jgi:hypothetical protein
MMAEAYRLSLVAVLAALSFFIIRAAVTRPNVLLSVGIIGALCVGYVVGNLTQKPNGDWERVGLVRAPVQIPGSVEADRLALAPPALVRGLPTKNGQISVDVFDDAGKGTLGNHDVVSIAKGAVLRIAGWGADAEAKEPCKALYLTIDKQRFIVPYGHARPDVAAYFHNPALAPTGFNAQIPTAKIPKGKHAVNIECLSADRKTLFTLALPRAVVVD